MVTVSPEVQPPATPRTSTVRPRWTLRGVTESATVSEGDFEQAFALSRHLVAEARAGVVLPRPVGNAIAVLTGVMLVS